MLRKGSSGAHEFVLKHPRGVRTPNRTLNIPGYAKKISIHKGGVDKSE